MADRPIIAVQRPCIRRADDDCVMFGDLVQQAGAPAEFVDTPLPWFDVWCSEHELIDRLDLDDLNESDVAGVRGYSCFLASKHASDFHDGDVERDGWS